MRKFDLFHLLITFKFFDRSDISLPGPQEQFLETIGAACGNKVIFDGIDKPPLNWAKAFSKKTQKGFSCKYLY